MDIFVVKFCIWGFQVKHSSIITPKKVSVTRSILGSLIEKCPSVSGPKALKKVVQFQWKVTEHFRNRIKKNMECSYKNRSHWKNISQEKIRRQSFIVYVLIYPLSKFGGNRTNSLWVLAFSLQCPLQWKFDSRKQR